MEIKSLDQATDKDTLWLVEGEELKLSLISNNWLKGSLFKDEAENLYISLSHIQKNTSKSEWSKLGNLDRYIP